MTTFKELRTVVKISVKDKSSRKRMGEIAKVLRNTKVLREPTPENAVKTAEALGPTFVKMGQIASNRSDLLPKEYCIALSKLRANVPAMSFDIVQSIINQSFGCPRQQHFAELDPEPLGSASIAQVHKAVLHDGTIVAVKVRRPGIVETMRADIQLLRRLVATAEFMTPANQMLKMASGFIDELERTTQEELDFSVELNNLIRFYKEIQNQPGVSSPLPFPQLSSSNVLVMEFVDGFSISNKEKAAASNVDLAAVGELVTQSYVTQIIDNGFFHADPHPGNIKFCNGEAVWIDLGMTGSLNASQRTAVGRMFLSIASNNVYDLKDALLSVAKPVGEVDHGALLEDMQQLLSQYGGATVEELNVGQAFVDLTMLLHTHNIALPPALSMLGRSLLTLEGVIEDISPQINLVQVISDHVQAQMQTLENARDKAKSMVLGSMAAAEASVRLPKQASNTLDMLQKGQLGVGANINVSKNLLGSIYTIVGRLSLALISAALYIGSAMMTSASNAGPEFLDIPVLAYFGFLGAFILSIYVIFTTIRNRHQIRNDLDIT